MPLMYIHEQSATIVFHLKVINSQIGQTRVQIARTLFRKSMIRGALMGLINAAIHHFTSFLTASL